MGKPFHGHKNSSSISNNNKHTVDTSKALDNDCSSSKMSRLKGCMLSTASFTVVLISDSNPLYSFCLSKKYWGRGGVKQTCSKERTMLRLCHRLPSHEWADWRTWRANLESSKIRVMSLIGWFDLNNQSGQYTDPCSVTSSVYFPARISDFFIEGEEVRTSYRYLLFSQTTLPPFIIAVFSVTFITTIFRHVSKQLNWQFTGNFFGLWQKKTTN